MLKMIILWTLITENLDILYVRPLSTSGFDILKCSLYNFHQRQVPNSTSSKH